jgi:NAD(P)-dependent dehydrogenase (short-subunit alcohol dehydrogenase family)
MRQKPLQGPKTVLVTGGARGIGRGTALLLAGRGYRVAVADLDGEAELPFFRCDVSREPSVKRCVSAVLRRFGRLDALVNNAGIADPAGAPVEKLALRDWNRKIAVNLTGAFLMTKHCVPHLRRTGGSIVNIASTRALQSEPDTGIQLEFERSFTVAFWTCFSEQNGPQIGKGANSCRRISKSEFTSSHPCRTAGMN